jgi:CHAT domain-containing protein/tetratricopeptide (TPR) repeat protein
MSVRPVTSMWKRSGDFSNFRLHRFVPWHSHLAFMLLGSFLAHALLAPGVRPQEKGNLPGPQQGVTLELNKPLERELSAGHKDLYQISLAEGQYASIVIEHRSMDLLVRLLDAGGTPQTEKEFNFKERPDVFEFAAEKSGVYQIQFEPIYAKALAGKYQVRLAERRAANEKDLLLYEARRRYSESMELYRAGWYDKAQPLGERALEIREKVLGSDHPEVAASLNQLGLIYTARSDYARAETFYQRALAINEKAFGRNRPEVAEVLDSQAQDNNAEARYGDAERLAKEALSIREKTFGADHFLVALSLGTLGDIYLAKGDYQNAQLFSDRALGLAAKWYAPDDLPYTDFIGRAARTQIKQGNYSDAEQLISQALRTRERIAGKDSLPYADSLADLAYLYVIRFDNVKSEELHLQALALKEKILGPDHLQISMILNNLGLIQYRRHDYSSAEKYHLRSLAIKEKTLGPSHPLVGYSLNNLGLVYWKERNYPKAQEFFQRALELEEKIYGSESDEVALPLINLGVMAKETGDYDRAESYYRRGLAIQEKTVGKQSLQVEVNLESLGILYRDKGDYAAAEPMFLRALAITEALLGRDHPSSARLLRNLEQLYAAEGDVANIPKLFQRLSAIEEADLPLNLAIGSERQKLDYFDSFSGGLEKIISFHVLQDAADGDARDLAATVLLQRKGRVLDAMAGSLGALRNRSTAEDQALFTQLNEVTSQLATFVLNGPQRLPPAEHQQRIKTLTAQREEIENQLSRRTAGYFDGSGPVTLATVKAVLPSDAALVEFAVYRPFDPKASFESNKSNGIPRYVVYVIGSRDEVRWKDLGPANEVDDAVEAFRQGLRDPRKSNIKKLARSLDEKVFRPIRVLAGDVSHLLVSPDGQLDLIPFEALVDEQGRYAVERYSITYLTTGRDLLRMQVARASKSGPVVIADPFFGEPETTQIASAEQPNPKSHSSTTARRSITTGEDLSSVYFAPLGGTSREARAIQSLFPEAQVLTGPQAAKDALKRVDAPRILHIATHGFFLRDAQEQPSNSAVNGTRSINASAKIENPLLRSGLALAGANLNKGGGDDGVLTALEASNLNLWGTKLVTLSACDTGVGEVKNGEGVYGLRRAFFLAGTESLVMSLWPVSDYVTRELMVQYYAGLKKGLGRGEALRQAQLAMLKRKDRQHPFYWASFIQAGEWANLDGQR